MVIVVVVEQYGYVQSYFNSLKIIDLHIMVHGDVVVVSLLVVDHLLVMIINLIIPLIQMMNGKKKNLVKVLHSLMWVSSL